MKGNNSLFICLFALSIALASCATAPSSGLKPVPAGYLYKGSYINVRVPNANGWHLISSSAAGMEFVRKGIEPGETFGAQVFMFPLKQTQTKEEFLTLIKDNFRADTDSERFAEIESKFEYSEQRSYPCVDVMSVVEDKHAQTSPNHHETLVLQLKSLYCRHPVRQETGFGIIYSHRGKATYPNLETEAKDFIDGVQVTGH